MNIIDRLIAGLVMWKTQRVTQRLTVQAVDLNEELTALHCRARHDRDREDVVRELFRDHPPAAVANIAAIRGFKQVARVARRIISEEKVA